MAELVDAVDSKSAGRKVVRVQVPLCPPDADSRVNTRFFIAIFLFLVSHLVFVGPSTLS